MSRVAIYVTIVNSCARLILKIAFKNMDTLEWVSWMLCNTIAELLNCIHYLFVLRYGEVGRLFWRALHNRSEKVKG